MMNGITIIETISNRQIPLALAIAMTVIGVAAVIVLVSGWIRVYQGKDDMSHWGDWPPIATFVMDLLMIIACCVALFGCWNSYNTIETKYRVAIDKSVSLVEFNERYEIVAKDGNEYVIEEKAAN